MNYKLIVGAAILLLASFATGRWLAPTKVVTEIKTVEVEKKVDTTTTQKDEHKTTVVTEKPDGTKQTVITDDTHTGTKSKDTTVVTDTSDTTKTVTRDSARVTVSALGAINIHDISTPVFGVSITKPILGPLTVGVFGLSSGVAGASIGLTF